MRQIRVVRESKPLCDLHGVFEFLFLFHFLAKIPLDEIPLFLEKLTFALSCVALRCATLRRRVLKLHHGKQQRKVKAYQLQQQAATTAGRG